jgi:hypothetical protein
MQAFVQELLGQRQLISHNLTLVSETLDYIRSNLAKTLPEHSPYESAGEHSSDFLRLEIDSLLEDTLVKVRACLKVSTHR